MEIPFLPPYFPRGTTSSERYFDDFSIEMREITEFDIRICNSPRLNYLNLSDIENKQGNYRTSIFRWLEDQYTCDELFKNLEDYTSAKIFRFYVNHLRNIPKDSIDLQVLDRKIYKVVANLRDESSELPYSVCNDVIRMYCSSPQILLSIILKHLCTTEDLLTYTVKEFFNACNVRIFKKFLDTSLKIGFNFWKRNCSVNSMRFCPLTYAYFTQRFDYATVLLDYGFRYNTHQRAQTLQTLLKGHPICYDFEWVPDYQSSRSFVIDEVFLFISVFLDSFTSPEIAAKCFELAWNARKDPYVTKEELSEAFTNRFPTLFPPDLPRNKEYIRDLRFVENFDIFQTLLPDYQGLVLQPRSLKHLSRCTVREVLNDNCQIPHGVEKLPIPGKMKSYILLK